MVEALAGLFHASAILAIHPPPIRNPFQSAVVFLGAKKTPDLL